MLQRSSKARGRRKGTKAIQPSCVERTRDSETFILTSNHHGSFLEITTDDPSSGNASETEIQLFRLKRFMQQKIGQESLKHDRLSRIIEMGFLEVMLGGGKGSASPSVVDTK